MSTCSFVNKGRFKQQREKVAPLLMSVQRGDDVPTGSADDAEADFTELQELYHTVLMDISLEHIQTQQQRKIRRKAVETEQM